LTLVEKCAVSRENTSCCINRGFTVLFVGSSKAIGTVLSRGVYLPEMVKNESAKLNPCTSFKKPSEVDLTAAAYGNLPRVAGKPRKFIGWWPDKGAPSDHCETSYLKDYSTGIGKSVPVGAVY
jgi:hypothetical protein